MILSFILYGLLISYFAFILTSFGQSRKMIDFYRHEFERLVDREGSFRQLIQGTESVADLIGMVPSFAEQGLAEQSLVEVQIYRRRATDGSWDLYALPWAASGDAAPEQLKAEARLVEDEFVSKLERAAAEGHSHQLGLFLGNSAEFSFFINVSGESDQDEFVLHFSGNRRGLRMLMEDSLNELFLFSLTIILVSLVVGFIFTRKITRPLNWLAREAQAAAEGEREIRFNLEGRDSVARLGQALDKMNREIGYQIARIQRQADTLETMNAIDKAVLSSVSRKDLLNRVSGFVASLYPENGLLLYLKRDEKESFEILYENRPAHVAHQGRHLIPYNVIAEHHRGFMEESAVVRIDDESIPEFLTGEIPAGTTWLLSLPIYVADEFYGGLVVSSDLEEGFTEEEIDVLAKLNDQVGVALQSLLAVEQRESLLYGSLRALSASIDAKSRWTAGHSSRVQRVAEILGAEVRLLSQEQDSLSVAALLHDIGKLGIPESVLDKPGRLTEEEYAQIKTHPRQGADIFGHIPENPDVLDGILYHHEQWAGGGYPEGRIGEDIPFQARIICVADVYDAITDDRPYRKGMSRDEVIDFFQRQRGIMFDPRLTDLFLELFHAGKIELGGQRE